MAIQRSIGYDKIIGERIFKVSEYALISEKNYTTCGESFIIIKDVDFCKIKLDSLNTDHIRIKSFANALLIPDMGLIDEEYEKISLSKGACVELKLIMGNWYILSSDGLKLNLN